MDDKTLLALTALARKLGTTAEYLWGVLLRQAPITGAIDLAVMVVWLVAAVWWFRFVQRKTTVPAATAENKYPKAQWTEEGSVFAWGSVIVCWVLLALIFGSAAPETVAALLNPEYWALKQIIK